MAENPYVNKVEYAGQTLIDLTSDTVAANKVLSGYTAHDKSGAPITGSFVPTSVITESLDTYGGTIVNIETPNVINVGYEGINCDDISTISTISWTLNDTNWGSWTPSTSTSTRIKDVQNATTFSADMANYDYLIKWFYKIVFSYDSGAVDSARTLSQYTVLPVWVIREPNAPDKISAHTYNLNISEFTKPVNIIDYYNASGNRRISLSSYGVFIDGQSATLSSSSSDTPTVTVRTPVIYARCNTDILSTSNAALVNATNTTISLVAKLYRYPVEKTMRFMQFEEVINWYKSDNV